MWQPEDEEAQPFKVTPGFIAFVALIFMPVLLALGVYFGAWMVASEVHAAEARSEQAGESGFNTSGGVAGWKRTLVGICPAH